MVDVSPLLRDALALHRADSDHTRPDDFVFATSRDGAEPLKHHAADPPPAIERANVEPAKAGRTPIAGVTNHSLRRTFCALLYEARATPAYVMAQMGHRTAPLALEVYSQVMERKRDTGAHMDALVKGAD